MLVVVVVVEQASAEGGSPAILASLDRSAAWLPPFVRSGGLAVPPALGSVTEPASAQTAVTPFLTMPVKAGVGPAPPPRNERSPNIVSTVVTTSPISLTTRRALMDLVIG